ncbi:SRPBCC family protein [uncultured Sphingomonas sp.]|uniref:SRPBCC family protein n=1 Tax=uncultured Sphingomonas sp. TaxID=158754 RepID=UPI0025F1E65B|nr:SRPBCC family protein [uncultured Sphingomonas sp.]
MAETMNPVSQDDAPLSTANDERRAIDAATDGPLVQRGDKLVARAVTINRPRAELYAFWRDFSNLPPILDNVVRIEVLDRERSHWVVKSPGGGIVEWDSRITEDRDGELIAWASEEGADIPNSGRIEFRDAGSRGTVVVATINYDQPFGTLGRVISRIFQREPKMQAQRDLRRFKQLMETGEIATSSWTKQQREEERG